ncbi:uncharacterized protein LOC120461215 [Pimephales promelas]|uniref:uncharacterized protein LOC120461215 n=1 Tax=Pimephales promelas TaxID=90988 RepID=UPI00195561FF|nr:uncharacterized protein LOC120461215 [Pimephales promelas]KAG1937926.1 hypothetical protein F2P79_017935 [Pimephales promelas]
MSNSNREKRNRESDQSKQQHAHVNRSRHDATLMNPGPPALYRLNTERKCICGTDKKVRQWTYGRRDRNKQNKVILMVGETGTGKTTMINTMINYILGVKFEDQEFYQITQEDEHKDQSQSQTSEITVYEAFVEENPTSLTIIDTPGYGDTEGFERDEEISKYLTKLFSDKDGIHYIDAVCFVMKASQNRLSDRQLYIFQSVLSLFGKDIEENIVFLLTHSDGGPPTDALNAIKKAEIPCRRDEDNEPVHFLFNNRQKQKRDKKYNQGLRSAWGMGEESMNELLTLMDVKNRKSVEMTLDVLKERRRLEACVSNLKQRIEEKLQTKELNHIQEILRQNRDKIKKGENFEFTVKRDFKVKVPIVNEWPWNRNATCCSDCRANCHEWGCNCVSPDNLSQCSVMKDDHCTVCSGKCHYSKHVREDKKYVTETKDVIMTFNNLKQEYCSIMKESENKIGIEEQLIRDLEKTKEEKSKLLYEAYMAIVSLSKIALKADSAFTLQYLDFLIPRLKEEGKEEWMKKLQDLRKAGEEKKNKRALQYVWGLFSRDKK